ncbi:MAG: xylulose kinase [Spirochaetes bacterium]|nr:MAG: xylulose kinase [Spirochaetota bacterium]
MSEKEPYVLAVDIGTSGVKTAIVSLNNGIIGWEFQKTRLIILDRGGAEQDPLEWWEAFITTSRRLVKRFPPQAEKLALISCTTQWSGTVPVDREGNPLMNAIIWMDSRGAPIVREITRGKINLQGYDIFKLLSWIRSTGGIPGHAGKDSIAHILYIKEKHPHIYRDVYKFLEPKDYINMKLTGNFFATFDSIALHWITDNRNIGNVHYKDNLLKFVKIDKEKLPELRRAVDITGKIKKEAAGELGIPEGIEVIGGTPDVHSACIGSGAVKDYEPHLYIGTSSWISCHVPFKKTDLLHNMATLPSAIPDRYILADEQETAGACLDFIYDILLSGNDSNKKASPGENKYEILEALAQRAEAGSGGVIFTPWLFGERTPVENSNLRSCFYNVSLNTTREQFVRAVYEGVAFNTKWLLYYVEKFVKKKFAHLNIIGGGAYSDFWCQLFADILGCTIRQIEQPGLANLRGAAFLGFIARRVIAADRIHEYVPVKNIFTPNQEKEKLYKEMFKTFLDIYRRNRKIFNRINIKSFTGGVN